MSDFYTAPLPYFMRLSDRVRYQGQIIPDPSFIGKFLLVYYAHQKWVVEDLDNFVPSRF